MQRKFFIMFPILLLLSSIFSACDPATWDALAQGLETYNQQQTNISNTSQAGTTFRVSAIAEFDWIKGNYDWIAPSKQRLLQSQFVFHGDGSFTYVLPYDNTTTYRLYGAWSFNDDGERIFQGSTGSSNGAGSSTSILISGRTYAYAGQTRATITYASGANYYAKVNNAEFTNNASKRFNAKVVLVR